MQSKGVIRLVAIIVAVACLYQLSFTWVTNYQESKAKSYAAAVMAAAEKDPDFSINDELNRAIRLDSLYAASEKYYLDSIAAEKVFFAFTYKECKEKELNLGLDLKGGMNVTLEVSVVDIVKALSNYSTSPEFNEALKQAIENQVGSRSDFVTLFGQAWDRVALGQPLSKIFATYELRDNIKPETTNSQVLTILRESAESAIANSFNVLRNRIDRFGVTQPNIQRLGRSGRILVELPGVKEPDRVRKLLQGTASLEFWKTYDNAREIYPILEEANRLIRDINAAERTPEEEKTGLDSLVQQKNERDWAREYPLFSILHPFVDPQQGQLIPGACIGKAHYRDTGKVMKYLNLPQVRALFPRDFRPLWSVKPATEDKSGVLYELIAIRADSRDGKAPLDGGVVTDARKNFGNMSGAPEVSMSMNAGGARIWAQLTKEAFGPDDKGVSNRSIAVVLDGAVYSYPRVNAEITGGSSVITGNFTVQEADDLANVLKSGKLPAPARIIQEAVVGPSLGQASINAGMISFLLAFFIILLYMIVFYHGAGVAANFALLANVLFLIGALASFGAVLTFPGIAGIVLTTGMAIDANVIIYERVKEELRAGKSMRMAVTDGYKNAYSAIIDSNLTSILVGIVLFSFGSGPIQGFATTFVVGIITSLFTSIFITRLIFEGRMAKGRKLTFSTKFTENFLANTKIDFMSMRKYAYGASIGLTLICCAFLFTKGFSYGVDFTGGRTFVVRFDQMVSLNDVRSAVEGEFKGEGACEVKQFGAGSQMKITTTYKIHEDSPAVDSLVERKLHHALNDFFRDGISLPDFLSTLENPNGIVSSEKVGPVIASDLKRNAVYAVIIALLGIFLYIAARFRNWYWGLGGLISLMHDTILLIGFYSIFSGILPFNLDVDQTFITAVLTVIGYSINDSVVIFDRIREYRILFPKRDLHSNINEALNSTLSRTVNTGGSTLLVLVMISIFGGEVIRGFSVALSLGVIIGTYSSVFVGTPIVYDFYAHKDKLKLGNTKK